MTSNKWHSSRINQGKTMELSTEQRNKWRIYDSMQQLIGNEMKATCLSDCKNIHGKCFDLHPFSMKDMQNLLPLDTKLFPYCSENDAYDQKLVCLCSMRSQVEEST